LAATPQLPPVAKLEQKTVVDLVSKGKRIDERGPESYRPIQIQVGLIEKANGSAQVHLGKSKVLAGIKVQTGTPFPDTPDEGVLTVNAELVPLASPSFEAGPPSEAAIEISRVVDRGIRESKAIDMKSLVLQKGDICAMQKGGLYGFTPDEVRKAVHMAVGKAAENRARIMAAAKG